MNEIKLLSHGAIEWGGFNCRFQGVGTDYRAELLGPWPLPTFVGRCVSVAVRDVFNEGEDPGPYQYGLVSFDDMVTEYLSFERQYSLGNTKDMADRKKVILALRAAAWRLEAAPHGDPKKRYIIRSDFEQLDPRQQHDAAVDPEVVITDEHWRRRMV